MRQYNGYKYCPECECVLPIGLFHKNRNNSDDLEYMCIDCKRNYNKRYIEKHRLADKKWRENNREYRNEYLRNYRKKNSEKTKVIHNRYLRTDKGKLANARRRNKHRKKKSINLINNPFPREIEVDYHHVNDWFVIPMPRETHRYISGNFRDDSHYRHNLMWISKIYGINVDILIGDKENE